MLFNINIYSTLRFQETRSFQMSGSHISKQQKILPPVIETNMEDFKRDLEKVGFNMNQTIQEAELAWRPAEGLMGHFCIMHYALIIKCNNHYLGIDYNECGITATCDLTYADVIQRSHIKGVIQSDSIKMFQPISFDRLIDFIITLQKKRFNARNYAILSNNCHDFAQKVLGFLGCEQKIPLFHF